MKTNNLKQTKQSKISELQSYLLGQYDIRTNIITNTIEKRPKATDEPFTGINEADLKYDLYMAGYSRFDGELKAILGSYAIPKYDPFKEYFEGLPQWDGQTDHIKHLTTFVQTDDQRWFEQMFKKALIRMVSQALGSLQFNKQCFTFVGRQNDGKTRFLEFLVPPKLAGYYKKGYEFHGGRQSKFSLVQNFIINLDELAQFDKKDLNNEFKATLSESTVKYAPLFSSTEVAFPRRASFVASTNNPEFLTDETGSVRWVIFNVLKIHHHDGNPEGYSNQVNIDDVWAQAYTLYQDGISGELTADEINQTELLNRRFMRVTAEMELIAKHFKQAISTDGDSVFHTATTLEKYFREKGYKTTHIQIGRGLKMLGFQHSQKYNSELRYQERGYWCREI